MSNNAPFFIIGVGRSGTSLLRLMLHSHPRIAIPYESHFLTKYFERSDQYGDLENDDNLRNIIRDILNEEYLKMWDHEFDPNELFMRIKRRDIAGVFSELYLSYAEAKGKHRWGDKSDYLDRMHLINSMYPEAQFIHIIRDGRDVAMSVMQRSWGPDDLIRAAEWWNQHVLLGRRMGAMIGSRRYTEVLFEELVQNPDKELKRLCDFLDESYDPKMLEYHKLSGDSFPGSKKEQHYNVNSAPKKSRTYAWKKEMSQLDVLIFNRYASGMLKEVGYEIPEIEKSKFLLFARIIMIFVRRILRSN